MVVIASLLTALASPAVVEVERRQAPEQATARRQGWSLRWAGGPADVLMLVDGTHTWRVLERSAVSPYLTRRLPPQTRLRLQRRDEELYSEVPARLWTPVDIAAWSGPGLRDVDAIALSPSERGLWVVGPRVGLALWDGQHFGHVDRREGLDLRGTTDLVVVDRDRWLAHAGGVVHLHPDGSVEDVEGLPEGPVHDLALHPDGTLWAATNDGAWPLTSDTRPVRRGEVCRQLVDIPDGLLAVCEHSYRLPEGLLARDVQRGLQPTALVPRHEGAWLATRSQGLVERVGLESGTWWLPEHASVLDLAQVGDGMLAAAGIDGLWRITEQGPIHVHPTGGLEARSAWSLAAHPHPQKTWVGTDRGVALVTEAGTATPLPLAPLAAGLPIRQVVPSGSQAGVSTDDGLRWLGGRSPEGWRALAAATGPADVLAHDGSSRWWAARGGTAWLLEDGHTRRFEVHAPILDIVAMEDAALLVTSGGVRWWLEDARMLSPLDPTTDLQGAAAERGIVWMWGDELAATNGAAEVRWESNDVRDVAADARGAWLASPDGLRRAELGDPELQRPWPELPLPGLRAVDQAAGRLWILGDEGSLFVTSGGAPEPVLWDLTGTAPDALDIVADRAGAWLITEDGLYRIVR